MAERRQFVRVRPAADYEVRVDVVQGPVTVQASVLDVGVGGVGLVVDDLFTGLSVDDRVEIVLHLPAFEQRAAASLRTTATVRHSTKSAGGKCGLAVGELDDAAQVHLRAVVGELLERGHSV